MQEDKKQRTACDEQRREFLKTSIYAAYATPVIMSVLVERASAANSAGDNPGWCQRAGGTWYGTGAGGCCDLRPGDGCGPDG
jgi:hypothetical protein